mmetsp:Transcript_47764/g.102377  ORF Transcript_47764/g.102377 Transcript_47764/m.102377 type:complete len:208 (+) Transcript_47764:1377-2000(+)
MKSSLLRIFFWRSSSFSRFFVCVAHSAKNCFRSPAEVSALKRRSSWMSFKASSHFPVLFTPFSSRSSLKAFLRSSWLAHSGASSFSSSSSDLRCCSCWARRFAFNLCTRFTVTGMRTFSSGASAASSSPPPMSQSSAAWVLFWCFRNACRAGPSSKPCESSEDKESGSTGKAATAPLAAESRPSPGLLLLSLANFSISRTEKSVTTS